MNQPLITIIMPAYNHEKYVEQAILSVINQSYKNIELIVIDDCSKDKTPEIIEQMQKQFGFTVIRHEQNKGICKTLNEGLKLAKGEYLCILASDDQMLPKRIETCANYLLANPKTGLVFSNANKIDTDGKIIENNYVNRNIIYNTIKYEGKELANKLLEGNCIPVMSVMIKTEHMKSINGFDESLYFEDWDAWIRLAMQNVKFGYIDEGLVNYRITPNSMSKRIIFIDAKKNVLSKYKNMGLNIIPILNNLNMEYAKYYLKTGNYFLMTKYIIKFLIKKI